MRAVQLTRPGLLESVSVAEPERLAAGEVLVRVRRIGVCGTDFHAFAGRQPFFSYPRILGHELGVEVVAIGADVAGLQAGARCAVLPYLACGACSACRRGRTNCCTQLRVLGVHVDGGMQEHLVVPAQNLFAHDTLDFEQLALVETLGIGAHAVERAGVEAGELALVVGLGPIGLGTAQIARAHGAQVIGLDADPARRALAHEIAGIEVLETTAGLAERLGQLPAAVFDATGNAESMNAAVTLAAPAGRVVFVGLHRGEVTFPDPLFHGRELTLHASRNATATEFRTVLAAIASGALDTHGWITHRAALADVPMALPHFADRAAGVLKAVIEL